MNRLLVWDHECSPEGEVRLTDRRALHIRTVLRAEVGTELRAGFINGPAAVARITAIGDNYCDLVLRPDPAACLPAAPTVDLLLAMPRPKCLKRILPQLATLGVRRLFLTAARRVERFYFDTHLLRPENYLPLVLEGLEQAMDTRLPEIKIVRPLRNFLRDELAPQYAPGHKLLAHPGPRSAAELIPPAGQPLLIAVGPEGGWVKYELGLFESLGFTRFSLGLRPLRTDMACVALLSLADFLRHPTECASAAGASGKEQPAAKSENGQIHQHVADVARPD